MLKKTGTAIGVGLLAGLAGTIAMSLSQRIEMKITGRKASVVPAKAASKVLGIKPASEETEQKVSEGIHWLYGTCWGMARGLISLAGLRGWKASLLHFTALWSTELIMLPALKLSGPVTKWPLRSVGIDMAQHVAYTTATGMAFDLINKKK